MGARFESLCFLKEPSMSFIRKPLSFIAFVAFVSPLAAAEKRPVALEDILSIRAVSEPAVSPDGSAVLFTLASWVKDPESSESPGKVEWVSHVYRVAVRGGGPAQLTFGEKGESAGAWSPDGAWVSFLAARETGESSEEPKRQIWIMRASGGEAFRLTDVKESVADYEWSPDSSSIAFTTRDAVSPEEEQKHKRRDDPVVYEGDFRMSHLWTVELESRQTVQRTVGTGFTVKGRPSYSPDGSQIAFTAAPTPWLRDGRDDVYLLTLADGRVEKITRNLGQDEAPAFSPDGKSIAFVTTPNDAEPLPDGTQIPDLRNARLALYDLSSKNVKDLSDASFDRIPGEPQWTPEGDRLLFSVGDRAYLEVYAYEVASHRYLKLTEGVFATLGNLSRNGSVAAFTSESPSSPAEVYVSGPDFKEPQVLTAMNPEAEALELGATEVVTWKSTEGYEVEGVLVKPVGYEPGKRYPLMVVVHGGPTGAHFNYFRVRYGDGGQHWAGQGWAVLYPNPRGSTNYGEAFMRGNLADWGGGDYRDIMAGVDSMVARGHRRSGQARHPGLELRRIHDLLDRVSDHPLQGGDDRSGPDQPREHVRNE